MTDRSELIVTVRDAWAEALAVHRNAVPLDQGFFDAGGNSLLLVVLAEDLAERTGADLRVTDLFQHATVLAQAQLLAERAAGSTTGGTR
ncbi:acyl carrier protein [Actinoplanes oblitus]|uniref:Acyl carrier protein n=1 Tax=Actinoplanes oblitus TaxID=3040509 RepID=A0ABY8W994_9ACTN|nr:acyl carrier protein [Actinoplanes oblitus]WIM94416.1 acyl carrier protein [Actinoplanes oblitus]